jgi:Na+/melibiose symporter-like transporter
VPLYAQGVLGATPTEAGGTIAPMAVGWPIASAVSGRLLTRIGFRDLVRVGMMVVALSALGLGLVVSRGASLNELRVVSGAFGLGMGIANTALVIAVQTSVGFSQRGVATASTLFFRNIGGTVGVGVMGVVLARALLRGEAARDGGAALVARILGPERRSVAPDVLGAIAADLARGLVLVTWIIAGIAAMAALLAWLFPKLETPPPSALGTPAAREGAEQEDRA